MDYKRGLLSVSLDLFGDFGFTGGMDATTNQYQDAQVCINWYPEVSPSKGAKMAAALLSAPGLIQLTGTALPALTTEWAQPSSVTNLPVRGCWVLPGWQQALVVIGNLCYLAIVTQQGSENTVGAIDMVQVGTLATNSGIVSIRDNNAGGYAIIVDGPNYYLYNIATKAFNQGSDPAWLGANQVAYIDGWWIFNRPGTQTFYTNYPQYGTGFNGTYYALKDASSDNLMGLMENKEELWLIGERTTEIWYDAGGYYFPFQRLVGSMLQCGCKATYSIAQLYSGGVDSLMWFGRAVQGENVVIRTNGFNYEIVSTPAVSAAISKYPVTSDALAYSYQEGTHEFYVLTFPTADQTWVYDATMPLEYAWTQRLSYDPYAKAWHRHRSNAYMNFAGMRVVGDYQNGVLYQLTRNAYSDACWPLRSVRRSPYIWNPTNRERVFVASLQVDFTLGQGTSSGLGVNPQANLRLSRDYGSTYGPVTQAPMGAQGQFTNRCMWRRLGWSRGAVAEIEVIDPVNRDIAGATLKAYGP